MHTKGTDVSPKALKLFYTEYEYIQYEYYYANFGCVLIKYTCTLSNPHVS